MIPMRTCERPRGLRKGPFLALLGAAIAGLGLVVVFLWARRGGAALDLRHSDAEIQVVTAAGQPVPGATVSAIAFYGGRSNQHFQVFSQDGKLFPPATTDAGGVARIAIPDDKAVTKAGYSPQRADLIRATLRQHDVVFVHVDHPDHPRWRGAIATRNRGTVVLLDSTTVAVRARRGDDQVPARRLYPVLSRAWESADFSESNDVLTIRRVDLASKDASRWLRIVHVPDDGPAWFSELIDLQQHSGPLISLDVVLNPGVRVEGRLSDDVARPIVNGRVVAQINNDSWWWGTAAGIRPDGTFVLESLPDNENLQLIALCDGWVSQAPSVIEVDAYAASHPFSAPDYGKTLRASVYRAFPRLYRLMTPSIDVAVPMERTATADILVVDEQNLPIENARVSFSPNVLWFGGGATLLGQPEADRLTLVRAELASGRRRIDEAASKPVDNRYSARTNSKGIAIIPDLPAGATSKTGEPVEFTFGVVHDDYDSATTPAAGRGEPRKYSVQLSPGKTGGATVQMK